MSEPNRNQALPVAILVGAQLAIGAAALMAKSALKEGLSAPALAAWRLTIASVLVIGFHFYRKPTPVAAPLHRTERVKLVIAGVCLSIHFVAWFASLQYISVARSTLLVTTAPLWTAVGGVLFASQRLPGRFWAGLALAGVGVYLVTVPSSTHPSVVVNSSLTGDLLAVAGAIAIAAYLIITQPYQLTQGTSRVIIWTYSAAAVATWMLIPAQQHITIWPATTLAWASVIGMAVFPQLIGHTALNWSLRHFPAGVVSAATLLEPVFAGALAWLLLHEALTTIQLAGALVLLGGVGITLMKADDGRKKTEVGSR